MTHPNPATTPTRRVWLFDALALMTIAITAALLFQTTPTNGDFWWLDSARHAMNAVFLRDFVVDGGFLHPVEYATAYYKQYPAINIGFYPPLFYVASVPVLMIAGVSHAASQLAVILFAFAAGVMSYLILRTRMDRSTAAATSICTMLMPAMALWSRQVQIDVPAIAWLLAFTYFLDLHLRKGSVTTLFLAAACLGCAILTRAQAVFAIPVFLAFIFLCKYGGRPRLRIRIAAVSLMGVMALPAVISVAYFSKVNLKQAGAMPGTPSLMSLKNWTFYAEYFPEQMGALVLIVVTIALILLPISVRTLQMSSTPTILIAMAIASWLFFSLVSNKEPRFNLPCLPFLWMFSSLIVHQYSARLFKVLLYPVLLSLAWQSLAAEQVPTVTGMRESAQIALKAAPKDSNILISAHRDGNFIFNIRSSGERPDLGIRRGDKLFVEMKISRALGIKDRGLDEAAILDILRDENISIVVEQPGYLGDQPSMQRFSQILRSPEHFREIGRLRMEGQVTRGEGELIVYMRNGDLVPEKRTP